MVFTWLYSKTLTLYVVEVKGGPLSLFASHQIAQISTLLLVYFEAANLML